MIEVNSRLRVNLDQFANGIDPRHLDQALQSPVFVLSAPRSGSTLLMELLSQHESVWTIGRESHVIYREFPHLRGEDAALTSGRLTAQHADDETIHYVRLLYYILLQNHREQPLHYSPREHFEHPFVFVEKTPRNAINVPFLLKVFPEARFLILYRQPQATLSSLIEAWQVSAQDGRFVSFENLPNWHLPHWCFLLPPGWQTLINQPLEPVTAFQWRKTYELIFSDTQKLEAQRCHYLSFERLLSNPTDSIQAISRFLQIPESHALSEALIDPPRTSASTVTPPAADKWHRHKDLIDPLMDKLVPLYQQLQKRESEPGL